MTIFGLIMIAVAWLIQFMMVTHKDKSLNNLFLFIYGLGTMVFVYDAVSSGMTEMAVLNLAIAALSVAVFFKVNTK